MDCGLFGATVLIGTSVGCIAVADMIGTENVPDTAIYKAMNQIILWPQVAVRHGMCR